MREDVDAKNERLLQPAYCAIVRNCANGDGNVRQLCEQGDGWRSHGTRGRKERIPIFDTIFGDTTAGL
jgi:hypothetical protein